MRIQHAGLIALLCATAVFAQQDARRNWFDDPYFQATNRIPDCPVPAGPYFTEEERRAQAHYRAERGTSCWLAGACEKSSAYAYDRDIADKMRAELARVSPNARYGDSSLWITVQRRIVFIEGCVKDASISNELERMALAVPDVERAIANVYATPNKPAPYKLMKAR